MTQCADGHIVTKSDIDRGEADIRQAFTETKAIGVLPGGYALKAAAEVQGIASVGGKQVAFDTRYAACLTKPEIRAVMLHEAGHVNEPVSLPHILHGELNLLTSLVLYYGVMRHLHLSLRGKPRGQDWGRPFRKKYSWRAVLGALTVSGLVLAHNQRQNESAADLYSARHSGDVSAMQTALQKIEKIQPSDAPAGTEKVSTLHNYQEARLWLMYFGPGALLYSDHPATVDRVKILEAARPQIERQQCVPIAMAQNC